MLRTDSCARRKLAKVMSERVSAAVERCAKKKQIIFIHVRHDGMRESGRQGAHKLARREMEFAC